MKRRNFLTIVAGLFAAPGCSPRRLSLARLVYDMPATNGDRDHYSVRWIKASKALERQLKIQRNDILGKP